jgi:uncharacterized membrane protein YphA (DoxX/SURF4 family)
MHDLGRRMFGVAALCIGVVGLCFGELAGVWQPVPDFAAGWTVFPYLIAAAFCVGGMAVQRRRTQTFGGYLLAALFAFFAVMWVKRIILLPLVFAVWGGTAEQLAMALAGVLIALQPWWDERWRDKPALEVVRVLFGVCAIAFGLNHFFNLRETAAMVPAWIPPGKTFWAIATGVADVAAGLAIISGILAPLAARLLTLMFASFSAFIWLPALIADPKAHISWQGNAVNLALIGAVWVLGDALSERRAERWRPLRRASPPSAPPPS